MKKRIVFTLLLASMSAFAGEDAKPAVEVKTPVLSAEDAQTFVELQRDDQAANGEMLDAQLKFYQARDTKQTKIAAIQARYKVLLDKNHCSAITDSKDEKTGKTVVSCIPLPKVEDKTKK